MKSRGQSVIEVRRNEMRRKREMKQNKMKYMHSYGNTMFDGKTNASSRGNPKFEALKQKYLALVEDINKKLSSKKKGKFVINKEERFDFAPKPKEKKENLKKMKEDINVFKNMRENDNKARENQCEETANKKKKKKRDPVKGRKRKKTQDDMSIASNNNSVHINFLDDFQKNLMFLEENKKENSSSDEGRISIQSGSSGDLN